MSNLLDGVVRFEDVRGVGTIELDFVPNQRVYTFIGSNGVGKTKLLECLFTVLFLSSDYAQKHNVNTWVDTNKVPFRQFHFQELGFQHSWSSQSLHRQELARYPNWQQQLHHLPIVYLAAQNRGSVKSANYTIKQLGNSQQRKENYLTLLGNLFGQTPENFKSLNMDTNLEEWVIQRAQSANPYQSKADNRKIELDTLLFILNQIDERIDGEFLEISGDNRVFVKVEGQKRELTELSSGFTSVLKMVQSIIAGYSYFTNEQQIARVRGVVLIDEIESHLHNEWQVKIIPLLKKLFPNTTFLITTHSSLVISQLEQGEAYRLERDKNDGVVYGKLIDYPSNASLVDLLNEAFNVDLNKLKIERTKESNQTQAKQALLALVQQELVKLETK